MLQDEHGFLHVLEVVPPSVFDGEEQSAVAHLRQMSADMWAAESDEYVVNYVACAARLADHNDWLDDWSPSAALAQQQLGFLCAPGSSDITVKAIGPSMCGDSGDLVFAVACTQAHSGGGVTHDQYVPVPQGVSALAGLRSTVREHLATCGHRHRGATEDVKYLSERLNIGFLIFRENLTPDGRQCLLNYHAARADYPYWMCVWWLEPSHFRLAAMRPTPESDLCTIFPASEVPGSVKSHWTLCNPQAPFGEVCRGPPEFS